MFFQFPIWGSRSFFSPFFFSWLVDRYSPTSRVTTNRKFYFNLRVTTLFDWKSRGPVYLPPPYSSLCDFVYIFLPCRDPWPYHNTRFRIFTNMDNKVMRLNILNHYFSFKFTLFIIYSNQCDNRCRFIVFGGCNTFTIYKLSYRC